MTRHRKGLRPLSQTGFPRVPRNAKQRVPSTDMEVLDDFRAAVISTHRYKPDGSWNVDPRDGKYLHSHARAMRGLRAAIAA